MNSLLVRGAGGLAGRSVYTFLLESKHRVVTDMWMFTLKGFEFHPVPETNFPDFLKDALRMQVDPIIPR